MLEKSPYDGEPIPPILSCVDNGWLAAALILVRNTDPALRERAAALLEPMDFAFFYVAYDAADPRNHPGQIHGPYHVNRKTFGGFHRLLNTEQRITAYVAMARGQVSPEHYYRVERTLKPGEGKQSQVPEGEVRTYLGIPVFEGHYTYRGMRIVPSWGGSMFEDLMVTLFVPEERSGAAELGSQPSPLRAGADRARSGGGRLRILGILARLRSDGRISHLRRQRHRLRSPGLRVE